MRIVLAFLTLISLSSCTFITEYQMKDRAIEFMTKQYEETYRAEMKSVIGEKHRRGNDFIGYMMRHTVIKAEHITQVNPELYQVELSIQAITSEARNAMLKELQPVTEEHAANKFNFGDSLILLQGKSPNTNLEPIHNTLVSVRLINGEWVVR